MSSMTDQERALLQDFLQQLLRIRNVDKDPEAGVMIAKAFSQQPDASYLVVQRAILLEQALNAAKAEIARLTSEQRGASGSSFLGGANAWGREAQPSAQRSTLSVSGQPIPANPVGAAAASVPTPTPHSPFGSFLGQAAATAAGVAGGAFLFQGLENLLGFGHRDPSVYGEHHGQAGLLNDEQLSADVDPDAHAQDITQDIDWNDFDGDDSSSV
jgi:hypothetical protein